MKKHPHLILFILLLAVLAVGIITTRRAAAPAPGEYVSYTQQIMATPITVILPKQLGVEPANAVFAVFHRVEEEMSEWRPTSPLSAVNRAAGEHPVEIPSDLFDLLSLGVKLGDLTEGAFDITWAALWGLWDFRAEQPSVPEASEVEARAALVDYRKLVLDAEARTAYLPEPGMMLGLGGIAKGRALDLAAAELKRLGVESFLIDAGGQALASGLRGERPWQIGIRDPRGPIDDYFAQLDVVDASVATSGDYERYFIKDGERYHHILDPRTGYPTRGLRSATVKSADATLADALATAIMVMGLDAGMALVEDLPGVEAVLVDENARVHVSGGLLGSLRINREPRS